MKNARNRLVVVVVIAITLVSSVSATYPQLQREDCRYFAETGHHVCGEFLAFFETRGMHLTNLGETYIERFGVPGDYDRPRDPSGPIADRALAELSQPGVTKLNISATVRHIITGRAGVQTVFILVNDQWQQPVEGVAVEMVVHYQSGDQRYEFEPTDGKGFTSHGFSILPAPPGRRVVIDVTAAHGSLKDAMQIFFLPCW